jgi:hypothetical protein
MKKQLLIAAVAASMSSVAMADVSISGEYEGTLSQSTGTASFAQDLDLTIVATSGDTSVTTTIEDLSTNTALTATTVKLSTQLEGISFTAGNYESQNGNGLINEAVAAKRIGFSTTIAGVGVAMTNSNGSSSSSITLAGNVAGFDVKVQNATNSTRFVSVSTDVAGVAVAVERQKTATGTNTAYSLSTDVNGVAVAYENVKINGSAATQTDGFIGDISTAAKASAISASMNTAMGSVEVKRAKIDADKTVSIELTRGNVVYGYSKTTDLAADLSAKVSFSF